MNVLSWPAIVALEVTPLCNNRCPGCSNVYATDRPARITPAAQWETWLAGFASEAVQLRLTGGEPTTHPEFSRIFDAATSYDAWVTLFTNGRWHDPRAVIEHVRGRRNFSGMLISLHGARPETHESFSHVPGSFQETVINIQQAVNAGIPVALSTVITRQSWQEIEAVVALGKRLGARHIAFNRYIGAPDPEIEASPAEMLDAIQTIERFIEQGEKIRYGVGVPQCFAANASDGCLAGVAYASIDPWGSLRPCAHSPSILGSLREESFEQIWNGARMAEWRTLMPSECTGCAAYSACHGGCRAVQELRPDQRDALRCQPLARPARPAAVKTIPAVLRPRSACRLRSESFGFAVMGNGQVLPVKAAAREVILACDGTRTIQEICDQFGHSSLRLLGELLEHGMLTIA